MSWVANLNHESGNSDALDECYFGGVSPVNEQSIGPVKVFHALPWAASILLTVVSFLYPHLRLASPAVSVFLTVADFLPWIHLLSVLRSCFYSFSPLFCGSHCLLRSRGLFGVLFAASLCLLRSAAVCIF
ncbi:hypothetical protein KSP39_PZI024179 [Platanthera zijinensis]|uniref:Uncharacterized protein n=1 Tax=Platanthera zijinensis TaxID=2320716 RepID=A0AAP0FTP2_9ASPA